MTLEQKLLFLYDDDNCIFIDDLLEFLHKPRLQHFIISHDLYVRHCEYDELAPLKTWIKESLVRLLATFRTLRLQGLIDERIVCADHLVVFYYYWIRFVWCVHVKSQQSLLHELQHANDTVSMPLLPTFFNLLFALVLAHRYVVEHTQYLANEATVIRDESRVWSDLFGDVSQDELKTLLCDSLLNEM